jgi:predicted nucleic acid-binding protein
MERIYKTVMVTKPTAHCFEELRKSVDRQAALVASGCSHSAAVDLAEQMRWFTDEQFNQVLASAAEAAKQVTKSADDTQLTSTDMTMNILKAKYGKE